MSILLPYSNPNYLGTDPVLFLFPLLLSLILTSSLRLHFIASLQRTEDFVC